MIQISDLTPLSFSFIAFEGEQRHAFLQGQISIDVMEVTLTHSRLGCYANPKGRVEAIFYLFERGYRLYWGIPYDQKVAEYCVSNLKKVAALSKVTVQMDETLQAFGLENPTPEELEEAQNSGYTILPCGKNVILVNNIPALEPEIEKAFFNQPWLKQEFEAVIPHITGETIGLFLPHHLNLLELGALNFKKGCYRGQEIIARMHYKSTIKKHLHALSYSGAEVFHPGQVLKLTPSLTLPRTAGEGNNEQSSPTEIEIVNTLKISEHKFLLLAIIDKSHELPEGFLLL